MRKTFIAVAVILQLSALAIPKAGAVVLISNGEPTSTIVIADRPTEAAREGAADLRMWLRKSSGATIEIISESEVPEATEEVLILVGDSERTRALGVDSGALAIEEFVIQAFPRALVILGDDERPDGLQLRGTLAAVNTFVDEILGVKFLWPGELGAAVPTRTTVAVGDVAIRHKPPLLQRRIRNLQINEWLGQYIEELGWRREDFDYRAEAAPWFRFHRLGGSYRGNYGHAFSRYWERYHKDHPDWFALQPDGSRDNSPERGGGTNARLCVSNPELIAHVARQAIETLRQHPTMDCESISPNDASGTTHCLCDRCRAWDEPDAETISIWEGGRPKEIPALTDRYVRFYSAVARIVAREFPDRHLGAYAYESYYPAPVRAKLHPNVIIGIAPLPKVYQNDDLREEMRGTWYGWSQSAEQLFLRPNSLRALYNFPTVYAHRLAADLRFFADHGLLFTDYDCLEHFWSTNGLNYYVLARLLWDPYRDVDEIIDEYCKAGFGPAGAEIRRYFDRLEQVTTQIAARRAFEVWEVDSGVLAEFYTDDLIDELLALLEEAEDRAAGDDAIAERIQFLRTGLDYVPLSRDYILAREESQRGDPAAQQRHLELGKKRDERFQELGRSWALNAPLLMKVGF